MTDNQLQQFVHEISAVYLNGYRRQKAQAERLFLQMESLEYRQALAVTEPEVAQIFESHTLEEREQRTEELAISVGVDHAIATALRKLI
jgi:hypothetical protein